MIYEEEVPEEYEERRDREYRSYPRKARREPWKDLQYNEIVNEARKERLRKSRLGMSKAEFMRKAAVDICGEGKREEGNICISD